MTFSYKNIAQVVIILLFFNIAITADVNPGDSIQDAIDNATIGDEICVHAGTYIENVEVDKRIALIGDDATIQAHNSSMDVILVTVDRVNISGFILTGADVSANSGIRLNNSSNNRIFDNVIFGNYVNIRCVNSDNNTIDNNTLFNSSYGIHASSSSNNTITNNNITKSALYGVCIIDNSSNNIIKNNIASDGEYTGIALAFDSNDNIIQNNIVNANRGYSGVLLAYGCEHNSILGNTINSNGIYSGIIFYERNRNNTIIGNWIVNNSFYGIWLYDNSDDNLIYNNYFQNLDNAYDDGSNIWNATATAEQNIIYGQSIGGNYWGDYTGNDSDCDGFGDTQYNISYWTPPSSVDHLPLIAPMCGDVDWNCFISANDVVEIYRKAVDPAYPISMWAADVDGNNYISANDVVETYHKAVDPNHNLNCTLTYGGKIYENTYKHDSTDTDRIAPCSNARISV